MNDAVAWRINGPLSVLFVETQESLEEYRMAGYKVTPLVEQVRDAQKRVAAWSPERRANAVLQGGAPAGMSEPDLMHEFAKVPLWEKLAADHAEQCGDAPSLAKRAAMILPCPFCGAPGYLMLAGHGFQIKCTDTECTVETPVKERKHDVLDVWNRRALTAVAAPADSDSKVTILEPGAPERDEKKGGEQAGSQESSSMDYGGGPFYGVEQAGSTPDETLREALAELVAAIDRIGDPLCGGKNRYLDALARARALATPTKHAK